MEKNYRIVVDGPQNARLSEEENIPEPGPHQVLIRNHYSVLSAGTERAWSTDSNNAHPQFPYYPGYCAAGEVVKIGSEVQTSKVGDRVVVSWAGHNLYCLKNERALDSSMVITNPESKYALERPFLVKIPDNVSTLDASFANIASFSFNGVRKLHLEIGESALIAGQGLLGVFALQVAARSGANPMMVADFSPERRELAKKLGADYALNPADKDYLEQIKEITEGEGVRAIVEVTGSAVALQQALEYVAWEGRISLLGCTRVPDAPVDFYKYVHTRGVQLYGAHTFSRAKLESAPYHWTQEDDYRAFLKLVGAGKMQVRPLISEIVSPAKAHEIYAMLATTKNPPLGIVFNWKDL